jgi:hypothetical protein
MSVIALERDCSAHTERDETAEFRAQKLQQYAEDTFLCLKSMADTPTGLPDDRIDVIDEENLRRSGDTNPPAVAMYIASLCTALKLFPHEVQTLHTIEQVLTTLEQMEDRDNGLFLNWYSTETGKLKIKYDENGRPIDPLAATVENGWLVAALALAKNSMICMGNKKLEEQAKRIIESIYFDRLYDYENNLFHGHYIPTTGRYSEYYVDMRDTEAAISTMVGPLYNIPSSNYDSLGRNGPSYGPHVRNSYERRAEPTPKTYGGSVFEKLLIPVFVPLTEWGANTYGREAQAYTDVLWQPDYKGARAPSPCVDADGMYRIYGSPKLGLSGEIFDDGTDAIHALFLEAPYQPQVFKYLQELEKIPGLYRRGWGFYDSYNPKRGFPHSCIAFDQGIIVVSAANMINSFLHHNLDPVIVEQMKPLIEQE